MSDQLTQQIVEVIVSKIKKDVSDYLMLAMIEIGSINQECGPNVNMQFIPDDIVHDLMLDVVHELTKEYDEVN